MDAQEKRTTKIAIKSITILWSENQRLNSPERLVYLNLRDANDALRYAAAIAPKQELGARGCAYDKTGILVEWQNGDTYEARVDLQHKDTAIRNILGDHIRDFCEFSSGRKCPPHMTPGRHQEYIRATAAHGYPPEGFALILDELELDEESLASFPAMLTEGELLALQGFPANGERPVPHLRLVPAQTEEEYAKEEARSNALLKAGLEEQERRDMAALHPPKPESNYNNFKGAKYDDTLRIGDIAKRIRLDIKAAVKAGELPAATYKVRPHTARRSTNSLDVEVSDVPGGTMNEEWVLNGDEHGRSGTDYRYSPATKAILEKLEPMIAAYNYDRSDSQSDYFNVGFYGYAKVGYDFEQAETARIRAQKGVTK